MWTARADNQASQTRLLRYSAGAPAPAVMKTKRGSRPVGRIRRVRVIRLDQAGGDSPSPPFPFIAVWRTAPEGASRQAGDLGAVGVPPGRRPIGYASKGGTVADSGHRLHALAPEKMLKILQQFCVERAG